ncbi:MAG: MFS transporter [Pseudomonadota bacterium]
MNADAAPSLWKAPDYGKIWFVGLFSGVIRWLEMLAFGVYAYDVTGAPLLVALLVILRFLPLALFGVFLGALSDRFSPRRLMIFGLAGVTATSALLWADFRYGEPAFWHVAVAAFISGAFWASDFPFRRKMIGDRVPPSRLAEAMAMDQATSNGTRAMGPLLGGAIYQFVGLDGVFLLGAVLYGLALLIALLIRDSGVERGAEPGESGWERFTAPVRGSWEALRYAARNRDVGIILAVTVVFNIWGFPYLSMMPVIGKEELGLTPSTIGAITALEGFFALVGALIIARFTPVRWYRLTYFTGVLILFLLLVAMGAAPSLPVLAIGLAVGGFCTAAFAVMQATLIYSVAPAEMRGRFLGLMTIAIGSGCIGFANMGLTAELLGASNALLVIGLQGLAPLLFLLWRWRELG